jgi:hypothetical protein
VKDNPYTEAAGNDGQQAAVERMLEVYTVAIDANARGDKETTRHALALLKSTLRPEADLLLANRLAALYETAEASVEENRPEIAAEILEHLLGLWTARLRIEKLKK